LITHFYPQLAAGNTLEITVNSFTSSDMFLREIIKVFGTLDKQFNGNDYLNTYDTERTRRGEK